ncbi:MAG: Predicted nuclease of restriction endonuclease-like (RecB) superfamily, DUF1016 family, partial [Candidatus Kentron sp. G]
MFFSGNHLSGLSFSHFELIVDLDDEIKRAFYEFECIKGNWSVRELRRQIASLYYERSGLSENKEKLAGLVQSGAEQNAPRLAIHDPYIFEFLGIKPKEVMSESDLEDRLLDKLEDFLLELGHGFCFEARQKRILIGDTYGFIDLVFCYGSRYFGGSVPHTGRGNRGTSRQPDSAHGQRILALRMCQGASFAGSRLLLDTFYA